MKKISLLGFVLLFSLCLSSAVSADDGSLQVNNGIITNTGSSGQNSQDSIGYQVAPNLFLGSMAQKNKSLQDGNQHALQTAQTNNFKGQKTETVTQSVAPTVNHLFQKGSLQASTLQGTSSMTTTAPAPSWLIWLVGGIGIVLALIAGLFLGRRFSKIFRKKQKKES